MKITSGLLFFDKHGNPISFNSVDGKLITNLYLPKTSQYIWYENTIFIAEKYITSGGDIWYGYPTSVNNNDIVATTEDPFFLIDPDILLDESPQLSISNTITYEMDDGSSLSYSTINGCYINDDVNSRILRIDYCFQNISDDNIITSVINISDSDILIEINLYIETEFEDERYVNMLSNFGMELNSDLAFIFRNSDVNEDLPDNILLNIKRKELFLEHNNIKPYRSLSKALFNYLKFFGYYDIVVKSIYENLNSSKQYYVLMDQGYEDMDRNIKNIRYPNVHTGFISLFYDIIRESGEYDDFSIPITEKAFMFSDQEISVKLNGLKNLFDNQNILGDTNIRDITGELVYFNRYDLNTWSNDTNSIVINNGVTAKILIPDNIIYIQDVRHLFDNINCQLDPNITAENSPNIIIGEHNTCWVGYFDYYNEEFPIYENEPNALVGAILDVTNDSFNDTWDDISTTWDDTALSSIFINWNNIGHSYYYWIKWTISGNGFQDTIEGSIENYNSARFILPLKGKYDVEFIIYGYNNELIIGGVYQQIIVDCYEAEVTSMFRIYDYPLNIWRSNYLSWDTLENEWSNPIYDNDKYIASQIDNPISDYNISNYLQIDTNDPLVGINNFLGWDDVNDISWNDCLFITWDMLTYHINKLPSFKINSVSNGSNLQIGESVYVTSDYNIEEFKKLSDDLKLSDDEDFLRYDYTARPISRPTYIDVVGSNYGVDAAKYIGSNKLELSGQHLPSWEDMDDNWEDIPIHWQNMVYFVKTTEYDNPLSSDGTFLNYDGVILPPMVMVYFTPYKSKIPGITSCSWRLILDDNNVAWIDNIYFSYFFVGVGNYDVELIIEDSNGNISFSLYKNFINIIPAHEYSNPENR